MELITLIPVTRTGQEIIRVVDDENTVSTANTVAIKPAFVWAARARKRTQTHLLTSSNLSENV